MEICLLDILQKEKNAVDDYNNALKTIDFFKEQDGDCSRLIAEYNSKAMSHSTKILEARQELRRYIKEIMES